MILVLDGHGYRYEMEALARMFFHSGLTVQEGAPEDVDHLHTRLEQQGERILLSVTGRYAGRTMARNAHAPHTTAPAECERVLAVLLYEVLAELTGLHLPWGILTGIRPVKLVRRWRAQGMADDAIIRMMEQQYLVSPSKVALALDTAGREAAVLKRSRPNSYSLYVSIPFCPSRCSYCSFVSHAIEKTQKLVPDYLELLVRELEHTAQVVRQVGGLRLETIYFGGGTPTVLSAEQLRRLMDAVNRNFGSPLSGEYTVEAGRPDTVTLEKLQVLREYGATRISINPQTMEDSVLQAVGRRHTALQTEEAFALARQAGHTCINMDLIAGLPTDTVEGFCTSLDKVLALDPENITVHTLTVKRAADLTTAFSPARADGVGRMLDYANRRLREAGQRPYYLYRQKGTVGNLENVGYCKDGCEGLYNVFIMDETHTIVAVGAGGVTKLCAPGGEQLERIFNYKYPYEYNTRFETVLQRKARIVPFYGEHPSCLCE